MGFALKYRPRIFEDVIGQDHIVSFFKASIDKGKLDTTYLLCGSWGSGKTTVARLYARSLLCTNRKGHNPCNECDNCKASFNDNHPSLIEIDAASNNGVDDIRKLKEDILYSPIGNASRRIIIMDEVHMLTSAAQNSMLKILEEYSNTTTFIFCTTNPEKLLDTVKSRCITLWIKNIPDELIIKRLSDIANSEGIKYTNGALSMIARASKSHMRDAITFLEQVFVAKDVVDEKNCEDILGIPSTDLLRDFTISLKNDYTKLLSTIYTKYDLSIFIKMWMEFLIEKANLLIIENKAEFFFSKEELLGLIYFVTDFYFSHNVNDRMMFEYLLSLLKYSTMTGDLQKNVPIKNRMAINNKDSKGNYTSIDELYQANKRTVKPILSKEDVLEIFKKD
jgi:DNA polymerase-3 subunit gamma/tau